MYKAGNKPPCNDNSYFRRRYQDRDDNGDMVRLLHYVTAAQTLIKRYSKHMWKHSPDHMDYAFLEYQICTLLEMEERAPVHRSSKINDVAWVLEVKPVLLYNDPHLPF